MKHLPPAFDQDGFIFTQLARRGPVVLYRKAKPDRTAESFEVVIIQQRPAEVICGTAAPARETLPPTTAWGQLGWTYPDPKTAKDRFDRVTTAAGVPKFTQRVSPKGGV